MKQSNRPCGIGVLGTGAIGLRLSTTELTGRLSVVGIVDPAESAAAFASELSVDYDSSPEMMSALRVRSRWCYTPVDDEGRSPRMQKHLNFPDQRHHLNACTSDVVAGFAVESTRSRQ